MKETFITKKFGSAAIAMIETINQILSDYADQGYDLSLRQLYYQLVSRNYVPNTERSYKNVGSLVSDARMAGLIDWDMIKDRGREMVANPHWEGPLHFVQNVTPQYRFDLWADQENYVEVMVEKQALEGVLEPVCKTLDVPFTANKGYSSSSAMYEASKRFLDAAQSGKIIFVVYLGDHDPSGIDMSRDVEERLNHFLKVSMDLDGDDVGLLNMKRVALNMSQVRELNPPENPAKLTDSRASGYVSRFGSSSWELDAIEPRQLANLVTDAVHSVCDMKLFEKNRKKQESERKQLLKFAKTFLAEKD
jgi:hypothetical protein